MLPLSFKCVCQCVCLNPVYLREGKRATLHRAGFVSTVTQPKVSQVLRGSRIAIQFSHPPKLCHTQERVERLPRQLAVLASLNTSNKRTKTFRKHTRNTLPDLRHLFEAQFPSIATATQGDPLSLI